MSSGPRLRSFGFIAVSTGMLWLSVAIASTALWPTYASMRLVILVAVTTAVASAIAIAAAVLRWSSLVVLVLTVVAYLVLGVPLAVPDRAIMGLFPSFDGLVELVAGTALGWKQLLTISLPVGDYQSLLVPAFLLVLVTVVVSLSIALRSRFGELAAIGPVVILLVGILFGPDYAPWPLPVAIGLTASILLWLIWRRGYRRRESIRLLRTEPAGSTRTLPHSDSVFAGLRTLFAAGTIMALAAVAAIGATALLPPTNDRVVLRSAIVQPFDARDYPSPLSGFRKYQQQNTVERTIMMAQGLPAGARIRVATLDTYDGVVFSVGSEHGDSASGSFTRVPNSIDRSTERGERATVTITVNDYAGVWLPTVGKLIRVQFDDGGSELADGFFFNAVTGTAAIIDGVQQGDSYTITTVMPEQPDPSQLRTLEPGVADVPTTPVVPEELSEALDRYIAGVSGAGPRLVAMLNGLAAEGYVSHGVLPGDAPSRSGHAADRITELFDGQRMIGDQEQYAVAAALMARELGFPARVVFGFAPDDARPGESVIVRGGDASAWIEVYTTRFGWVAIDPTPPIRPVPDELPEKPAQVARPQSPIQPQLPEPDLQDTQLPPESSQDDVAPEDLVLTIVLRVIAVLGIVTLAAAVLLSPFLAIAVAKLRRRRLRRRAALPIDRISGGWQEFHDAVVDHGYNPGPAATRIEVAQVVGGTQPLVLASVVDRVIFSPGLPDGDQAEQLWRSVEELRFSLGAGLTRWQRIKVVISVRSLGGYSVTRLFKR